MPQMWRVGAGVGVMIAAASVLLVVSAADVKAATLSSGEPSRTRVDPALDPEGYLLQVLRHSDALDSYQVTLHLAERRGMRDTLSNWERVEVEYRKSPKSIRMTWLDPESEYVQVRYMPGRDGSKMRVQPRRGLFGLPARIFWVEPETAVAYGKALRPITDLGVAELIRVTLREMEQARGMGRVAVAYAGQAASPETGEPAEWIVIHYPPGYADAVREDLYISRRTGYPVAAYLRQSGGDLVAAYVYGEPRLLSAVGGVSP